MYIGIAREKVCTQFSESIYRGLTSMFVAVTLLIVYAGQYCALRKEGKP